MNFFILLSYLLNYLGEDGGFASVRITLANPPPLFFEKIPSVRLKSIITSFSMLIENIIQSYYCDWNQSGSPLNYGFRNQYKKDCKKMDEYP